MAREIVCLVPDNCRSQKAILSAYKEAIGYATVYAFQTQNITIIHRTLSGLNPDYIIVSGYSKSLLEPVLLNLKKPKKIIKWHSLFRTEINDDIGSLNTVISMIRAGQFHGIAFSSENDYFIMKKLYPNINVFYYPEFITLKKALSPKKLAPDDKFHADCFCFNPDPIKNIYNQLIACSGKEILNHVNYIDKRYAFLSKTFSNIINHGILDDISFQNVFSAMDLCLQVSCVDSYNIIAAEHMYNKVPVLASRFIPSVNETDDKDIKKYLIVDNIDCAHDIREKIYYFMNNKNLVLELKEKVCESIIKINERRKNIFLEEVNKF